MVDLAVGFHGVYEVGTSVLHGDGVAVVVVHVCEQVHCIGVVFDAGAGDDAEGVELVAECAFANDELGGVGAVETVDAVCAADAVLELGLADFGGRAVVKETGGVDDSFGDVFERFYHILITTTQSQW